MSPLGANRLNCGPTGSALNGLARTGPANTSRSIGQDLIPLRESGNITHQHRAAVSVGPAKVQKQICGSCVTCDSGISRSVISGHCATKVRFE